MRIGCIVRLTHLTEGHFLDGVGICLSCNWRHTANAIDDATEGVMETWEADRITTNGLQLHITRSGGAKPPVVLLHGSTDDGRCWGRVAGALAPTYDVIAVDARGHGQSDAPPDGYTLPTMAMDLAGLIPALGLDHPAILGHSLGAGIALTFAGMNPTVPRAIVLIDPGPWWTGWPQTPEEYAMLAQMRTQHLAYSQQSRAALIAERRHKRPSWSDEEREAWAEAKLRLRPPAFQVFDPGLAAEISWLTLLPQITCPTLLITTDVETGGVLTPETAASFQALVPHAHVAHVPQAGHSIHRDQFAPVMATVLPFLAESLS